MWELDQTLYNALRFAFLNEEICDIIMGEIDHFITKLS